MEKTLLTKEEILDCVKSYIDELFSIVGDTPVSVQLATALDYMALKNHTHNNYVENNEMQDLKQKIDMLSELVGDVPVSEQINAAITQLKE